MLTTDTGPHGVSNSSICCQNGHMLQERIISLEQLMSEQGNELDKVRTLRSKLSAVSGTESVKGSADAEVATPNHPLTKSTTQSNNRVEEHQEPETWLQAKRKNSKKKSR